MSFNRKKNRSDGGLKSNLKSKMSECHPKRKIYARGRCRSCYEKWLRENNPEFAERQKKNVRDWIDKNREYKKQKDKDYVKQRVKDDPQYHSMRNLRQYGMTLDDYDEMLKKQNGGCAICGREPSKRRLHVDHCHETGFVRGLLCFRCNFGLSYFGEDEKMLKSAYEYLRK